MTCPHQQKKKMATVGAISVILLAMLAKTAAQSHSSTSSEAVKHVCQKTDYKATCEESLSKASGNTSDPKELVKVGFQVTIEALKEAINKSDTVKELAKDRMASQALEICKKMMDEGIVEVKNSFNELGAFEIVKMNEYVDNLKVWISAAMSYQEACLDAFKYTRSKASEKMKEILRTSTMLTNNGLAMVTGISDIVKEMNLTDVSEIVKDINITGLFGNRRLLEEHEFPSWVDAAKRQLLAADPQTVQKNMTVAKDGSGNYANITEAIKSIPANSTNTFVLYVKEGVYDEQITFPRELSHVLLLGDGPTRTKITGKLSFKDGFQALNTATVTTIGPYFMAKDIGFENTAGPEGHQALALLVQSDFSVFYNCQIDGYQETLTALSNRQFYRDCSISGTVDFIKGDARAVFQNCSIVVRKPLVEQNQVGYITAQGRNNTREPTGFVLQNCNITADEAYKPVRLDNKAYLGRPWKEYARAVIMQSTVGDFIDPEGWGTFFGSLGTSTCYLAEYENKGPGADTSKRVTWQGFKKLTPQEADGFTAAKFLGGDSWIVAAGVPYTAGMMA